MILTDDSELAKSGVVVDSSRSMLVPAAQQP